MAKARKATDATMHIPKARLALDTEERIPKSGDGDGALICIIAFYDDGTLIRFNADTKAARRASKIKKGKSEDKKKKK